MAESDRLRKLRASIETNLGASWQKYLKPGHIYAALSDAQRIVCMDALCVTESQEMDMAIGEAQYPLGGNIHRITEVVVPGGWDPIEPIEPENWNARTVADAEGSACSQPVLCTVLNGALTVWPTPLQAGTITLWVALKPAEDGEDDVTEEDDPMTPGSFDRVLVLGATADLIRKVPENALVNPKYDAVYYETVFRNELQKMAGRTGRVQNRNPRSMRTEYRF